MFLHDIATIRTIITHGDCPDGLASAILLHDAIPAAEIRFLKHGTLEYESLKAEPGMLFADICPPFERVQNFIDAGAFVLDHHRTAKAYVERFGERGYFGDETTDPSISGAPLCYKHVWEKVHCAENMGRVPTAEEDALQYFGYNFAKLAGIRDTWQRKDPLWREALEQAHVLMFMPRERWLATPFRGIAQKWNDTFWWIGKVLYEQNERRVEKAVKGARYAKTDNGTRLVVFEGTTKTSDAAELLHEDADLVIGFNYFEEDGPEGRRTLMVVSTRSHTTYECSKLAEFYGGGGHTKAAGFRVILKPNDSNPYDHILSLVTQYETANP
jgi:hypothetical protein